MTNSMYDRIRAAKPRTYVIAGSTGVLALSSQVPSAVTQRVRHQVGRTVPLMPRRATLRVKAALRVVLWIRSAAR